MAKTYANTLDGLTLGGTVGVNPTATGQTQNSRRRTYASAVTFAAQAVADTIVVCKPSPNDLFISASINMTVTIGATATLALQLNKRDGTTVTLSAAFAYVATAVNTTIEMVVTNAALGTKFDGGEVVLVVAAAALPGAGTLKILVNTIDY